MGSSFSVAGIRPTSPGQGEQFRFREVKQLGKSFTGMLRRLEETM
jgi:hypothetical protein